MFSCVIKSYIDNMTYNKNNDKKIITTTPINTNDNTKPIDSNNNPSENNNSDK